DDERRAAPEVALDPHRPARRAHDLAHDVEAEAEPPVVAGRDAAPEALEDLLPVRGRDPDALVADLEPPPARAAPDRHDVRPSSPVLDRVREEVHDALLHARAVPEAGDGTAHVELERRARHADLVLEGGGDLTDHDREVVRGEVEAELPGRDPRHIEEGI